VYSPAGIRMAVRVVALVIGLVMDR
jgi:hypothetical protein